jgi:hypothetical protein
MPNTLYGGIMTDIANDLMQRIPIEDLAQKFGVSREEIEDAVAVGAPALLEGLSANARSSPDSASSLIQALAQDHSGKLLDEDDPLANVDSSEGEKIVRHIFGSEEEAVVSRLGESGANRSSTGLFSKLLPMLAPLVMGWVSRKLGGGVKGTSEESGGLGGVLGELLGGDSQGQSGGLGDLLGDALGGEGDGGGGLGDLLGGMLGSDKADGAGSGLGGLTDLLGSLGDPSNNRDSRIPDISDLLGAGR